MEELIKEYINWEIAWKRYDYNQFNKKKIDKPISREEFFEQLKKKYKVEIL